MDISTNNKNICWAKKGKKQQLGELIPTQYTLTVEICWPNVWIVPSEIRDYIGALDSAYAMHVEERIRVERAI